MPAPLHLRTPTPEDAPALVPLLAELGYTLSEDTVRANIRRVADGPADRAWVAEDERGIVGLVCVHLTPLLQEAAPVGRITSLVVLGATRGQGVGRALMQRAQDFCREAGCARIELTSGNHRHEAHRFYEGLGYQATSRRFVKDAA